MLCIALVVAILMTLTIITIIKYFLVIISVYTWLQKCTVFIRTDY